MVKPSHQVSTPRSCDLTPTPNDSATHHVQSQLQTAPQLNILLEGKGILMTSIIVEEYFLPLYFNWVFLLLSSWRLSRNENIQVKPVPLHVTK